MKAADRDHWKWKQGASKSHSLRRTLELALSSLFLVVSEIENVACEEYNIVYS